MSTNTPRILASVPLAAALMVGSLMGASSVFATGTCKGNATEYVIPLETQTVDPLQVYDVNGDGIVCIAVKGKKTVYGDNRI
jgi:hypothetical protein